MRAFDGLVAGLLALALAPAVVDMAAIWASVDYYAHGFLVAPVALGVAWLARGELATLTASRDFRALLLLGTALALYAVGVVTGSVLLEGLACPLAVAGAVWLLRGPAWLRALAFPIAYLVFMIPLPAPWVAPLITRLQLFVSETAVSILHDLAFPVLREGNVIVVPDGALFVAEACSGITSIITLLPIAVLLAYFTQRGLARRVVLAALVIPFAMLGNLARVLFTVAMAVKVGTDAATEGTLHQAAGIISYGVACGALLAADALLRRTASDGAANA
jgi:exosortase